MSLVFLDRDGVINQFPGVGHYVTRLEAFRMLPGAAEAIGRLTRAGREVHVISNQGCVARGLITMRELDRITARMREEAAARGGRIDGVHYCVHQTTDECECKKPKTALFHRAAAGRPIEWARAVFVGDSEEDLRAGRALGCRTVTVLSGRLDPAALEALPLKPDAVKADLAEAVEWILQEKY